MNTPRLFRVILPVSDISAAERLYSHLFGQAGVRVSPGRHYFTLGNLVVACYDAVADGDEPMPAMPTHHGWQYYFSVEGLAAFETKAAQLGMEITQPATQMPWGETAFYAKDPFGNQVCFVEQSTIFVGGAVSHGHKPIIGLVGGIGAGKSQVGAMLVEHGGRIIAGDPLGHEALEQPEIMKKMLEIWENREITQPNGAIDRKKLAAIVFTSPVERTRLEHLVHPYIERRIREEIEKAQADHNVRFVVLDAAIMLEAGWNDVCDKLIFVDAPKDLRFARIQAQRGWTEQDFESREAVQMPVDIKRCKADAIVDNGGWIERTRQQVDEILENWRLLVH
ncbi:MAG: dephospho-CoA kinase [Zavarzinella sp.]